MEDLELNTDLARLTARNWSTEFETFKNDIQNQQEIYQDIFKQFHQIQGQCQNDIDDVKNEMRLGVYNIWTDLSKQELYTKRKEKEYKRRIWLQGRKRRK